MVVWILLAAFSVAAARFLWRAYTHPAHVLGRQAARMNWVAAGSVRDREGYRNVRYSRSGNEAVVSFKNGNVQLTSPEHPAPFKDFVEVETWLTEVGTHAVKTDEIKYYEGIEKYVKAMGWYDRLLELQGTDPNYCEASLKVYRAGFASGQSEKVVGALVMESVNRYRPNRDLAILFLEAVERQWLDSERLSKNS